MTDNPWLPTSADPEDPRMRLFCFPYAGGGTAIYHRWQRYLEDVALVLPIKLPGREARIKEPAYECVQRLVGDLLPQLETQLQTPFAMFGHSMGALIAFELAKLLKQNMSREPSCLFVSACRPPHSDLSSDLHTLSDDEMIRGMLRDFGEQQNTSEDEMALMRIMAPTLRADMKLIANYQPTTEYPLSCPIVAIGGTNDPEVRLADISGWQRHTDGEFKTRNFVGGHFFMREQEVAITKLIRARLSP